MKPNELRELSAIELTARVRELKDEIFHLRIQQASGQLEKPHLIRVHRKEVARILTILRERQIAAQHESVAAAAATK
ncbi:MAG: 50S ribosomal protein L29 [Chthoniobacteraceae bacterium]